MSSAQNESFYVRFCLGGIATVLAATFTNPMEVVKTRLQLQGELKSNAKKHYKGFFHTFYTILKNEGIIHGIQRGLITAWIYQFMMNGTRLGCYDMLQSIWKNTSNDEYYFIKNILFGATSGTAGAIVASPFYMIKTRLQSFSTHIKDVGYQHGYQSNWEGFKNVWKQEGLKGMFRGAEAAALRVAVGSAVQLSTYDQSKNFLMNRFPLKDGVVTHFGASLIAGFFVSIAMNPFDLISTRMYNQKVDNGKGAYYKNVFDCIIKTGKTEGLLGFYKGWQAQYLRLAPHTILTFLFWEQLKSMYKTL